MKQETNLKTGPHIEVEVVSLSAQVSTGLEEQLNPHLHSNLTADDIMLKFTGNSLMADLILRIKLHYTKNKVGF